MATVDFFLEENNRTFEDNYVVYFEIQTAR